MGLHANIGSAARGTNHPERYSAPNPQAAEDELADFLCGIVRLTHPDNVLELGTYHADTTVRLAGAVTRNGHGLVTTVELDPARAAAARKRLSGMPARVLEGSFDAVNLKPPTGRYGVALFDSHWERDREYHAARSHLARGALLVFHDCGEQHKHGEVRARVETLITNGFITGFYVATPRGIILAQHKR